MTEPETPQTEAENTQDSETAAENTDPTLPAASTLNRAERRAQAQHKGGQAGSKPTFGSNARGFQPRGGNVPNKARIPRTGHK